MNRKICIACFFALLIFLVLSQSCARKEPVEISLPEGKSAEIIYLVGDVWVTTSTGSWIKAKIGDVLPEGVRIKTSENSYCELVISSGTIFRMKDRSEIELVMLPADEKENKSRILLSTGELLAKVMKLAYESEDNVVTSSTNLTVRGTEFIVRTVHDLTENYTEVLVARGVVRVRMNIKAVWGEEYPRELRPVVKRIKRGVKIRSGFKLELQDRRVEELSRAIEAVVRSKTVNTRQIARLKEDAYLLAKPLTDYEKKRVQELEDLSLSFLSGKTVWVSPNFDGKNDEFFFNAGDLAGQKVYGWKLVCLDGKSRVKKILRNRFVPQGTHVKIPERVTWNMVDENGTVVRDGEYGYAFYTIDKSGREYLRIKEKIVVDTNPPEIQVVPRDTTFSPNGDNVKDSIQIDIDAEGYIEWTGVITTPEGITVKSYEWGADIPEVYEWDGKGENGSVLPEGVYNITFSGEDRAGNTTQYTVKEIVLDVRERSATVDVDHSIFSPNGDGRLDEVIFYPILSDRRRIDTWDLIVQTEKGETAKRFRGRRYVPEFIEWNGTPQKKMITEDGGRWLPSGKYFYFLKVIYRSGVNTYSFKKELIIDNDPPLIDVDVTPERFSPDGDGENDILFIKPEIRDLSSISRWKATVRTADGLVFKTFSGMNAPGQELMWDGVSDTGRVVESGEDYYLEFEATDEALNSGTSEKVSFSIDILVLSTARGLKIRVSNIEFGFNTAQLKGERTFEILGRGVEVLNKYAKYSILIEGHTESTGDEEYNMILSEKRAKSVGKFLIENGIDPERLSFKGYGSQYPIDTNETREGRARNRRVEFILIREK
jgi:outer membrane protein OmpA-like peptidoglycan-associated protein